MYNFIFIFGISKSSIDSNLFLNADLLCWFSKPWFHLLPFTLWNLSIMKASLMGSRTWQHTTRLEAHSSNAVDGRTSVLFDPTTCSRSELPYQPWWTVDLGRERTIFEVTIFTPEDCCGKLGYLKLSWITNLCGWCMFACVFDVYTNLHLLFILFNWIS